MIISLEGKGELMREEIEKEGKGKICEKRLAHKHLFLRFNLLSPSLIFTKWLSSFREQKSSTFRHTRRGKASLCVLFG